MIIKSTCPRDCYDTCSILTTVEDGKVVKLEGTFMDYRMTVGKVKVDQIRATGANYVAAPCANCKRQVMHLIII